jgi:hydroxyethylthiazole kinase-like uncharacterized protein yjeF
MKLVSVSEMVSIEKEANANGLSYDEMMENAGTGLAEVILEEFQDLEEPMGLGLIGSGNNGGDTLVALAVLAKAGWQASAYIVKSRSADDPLVSRLEENGGEIYSVEDDDFVRLEKLIIDSDVLLDGLLGTGIKLPLRGIIADVLEKTNTILMHLKDRPVVVAVDCPSGVDCATGEAAPECIPADLTVTMAAVKDGLLNFPAYNYLGKLRLVGIGLIKDDDRSKTWRNINKNVIDADSVQVILPERPADAHKGTFGTALVVAGSINYTGAAILAGKAAYRSGAGLVTLAVPAPLHEALAGHFVEATWILLPHELGVISASADQVLLKNLDRPTAMLVGPGFGLEDTTRDFLKNLISVDAKKPRRKIGFVDLPEEDNNNDDVSLPPMVIDADGLKLLEKIKDWALLLPAPAVLTPHPGEMSVLTGLPAKEIQANRAGIAAQYAKEWGHVVVLKGANTVIAAPDGRISVIAVASASLARAGTGDVLAGIIVGLLAQGVSSYDAAIAGSWIHAHAGLRAETLIGNSASVLAGDVLNGIQMVLSELI